MRAALLLALTCGGATAQIPPADGARPTGVVTFAPTLDPSGLYSRFRAEVEVEVTEPGTYPFRAWLRKEKASVASVWFHQAHQTAFNFQIKADTAGRYTGVVQLSGEQIYASGLDGPYTLVVAQGREERWAYETPFYDHEAFGEITGRLSNPRVQPVDADGDGRHEYLEASADVTVRGTDHFLLYGDLSTVPYESLGRRSFSGAWLAPGTHTLTLRFPSTPIFRANHDGPNRVRMSLGLASLARNTKAFDESVEATFALDPSTFEALLHAVGPPTQMPEDTDGDGLYETMRVTLPVEVTGEGTYTLTGILSAAADSSRRRPTASARVEGVTRSTQEVALCFQGRDLAREGIDGPYRLALVLYDEDYLVDDVLAPPLPASFPPTDFSPTVSPFCPSVAR